MGFLNGIREAMGEICFHYSKQNGRYNVCCMLIIGCVMSHAKWLCYVTAGRMNGYAICFLNKRRGISSLKLLKVRGDVLDSGLSI